MTRETKIGLLVGLAFIIVIGILLSDHLSSTNEPAGAPLKVAGDTLRSGLGQPRGGDIPPVLRAPSNISPVQQVVINDELNHRRSTERPVTPNNAGNTAVDRLLQNARQHGEEIMPVNNQHDQQNNTGGGQTTPPPAPAVARTYEAQSGDSLGLIARKMYGSGCRANRDAIVAANPEMAQNRDLVVAGKTYIIPALATAAAPAPAPIAAVDTNAKTVEYIVQPHDTLWSIALTELGSSNAISTIRDLNKTVLNGSDRVHPNMKLTLPARKSNAE